MIWRMKRRRFLNDRRMNADELRMSGGVRRINNGMKEYHKNAGNNEKGI